MDFKKIILALILGLLCTGSFGQHWLRIHSGVYGFSLLLHQGEPMRQSVFAIEKKVGIVHFSKAGFGGNIGYMDILYVSSDYRNNGYGSALFNMATITLTALGCTNIMWRAKAFELKEGKDTIEAQENLRRFYQRLGGKNSLSSPNSFMYQVKLPQEPHAVAQFLQVIKHGTITVDLDAARDKEFDNEGALRALEALEIKKKTVAKSGLQEYKRAEQEFAQQYIAPFYAKYLQKTLQPIKGHQENKQKSSALLGTTAAAGIIGLDRSALCYNKRWTCRCYAQSVQVAPVKRSNVSSINVIRTVLQKIRSFSFKWPALTLTAIGMGALGVTKWFRNK